MRMCARISLLGLEGVAACEAAHTTATLEKTCAVHRVMVIYSGGTVGLVWSDEQAGK